jgi:hypothetical protein
MGPRVVNPFTNHFALQPSPPSALVVPMFSISSYLRIMVRVLYQRTPYTRIGASNRKSFLEGETNWAMETPLFTE